MLRAVGFSDVAVVPFYGHSYYEKMHGIRQIAELFWQCAGNHGWVRFASFCYVIARKTVSLKSPEEGLSVPAINIADART
jgi:hypothetical protein